MVYSLSNLVLRQDSICFSCEKIHQIFEILGLHVKYFCSSLNFSTNFNVRDATRFVSDGNFAMRFPIFFFSMERVDQVENKVPFLSIRLKLSTVVLNCLPKNLFVVN